MYSVEDFHRDVQRGISTIYDVANRIGIPGTKTETFVEEHNYDEYWRDALRLANHDPIAYKIGVVSDFLSWVSRPKFPTLSPEKTARADAIVEARIERHAVAAELVAARGLDPIQKTAKPIGPISVRISCVVFLRAIDHLRASKEMINEYINEAEHQEGFEYWYDNFYNGRNQTVNYGALAHDLIMYADNAAPIEANHPE